MTTTKFTNRYAGTCEYCQAHVAKDQGIYNWGDTFCNADHMTAHGEALEAQQAAEELERFILQRDKFVPSMIEELGLKPERVAKMCEKFSDGTATTIDGLTPKQVSKLLNKLGDLRYQRKQAAEGRQAKKDDRCTRCDGAGGSDRWADTGWTCYQCGGSGRYGRVSRNKTQKEGQQ